MKTLLIRFTERGLVALLLACLFAVALQAHPLAALNGCITPSTTYVDDDWVGTVPGTDPDGGGPAIDFGCDSFATVQGGVTGVTTGGNVLVASGTYSETQVLITKSVTVTGAGAATTIINGLNIAPPTAGLVHIQPPSGDTGTVGFSGFTITDPGSAGGVRTGMFVKPLDAATVVTISNNRLVGNNLGDYGLWAYRNRGSIVFTSNVITNTGSNGVLIEQPLGATDFSGNTITVVGASTSYFAMTYDSENITSLQRVANNTINSALASAIIFNPSPSFVGVGSRFGKYTNVEITGNTITNLAATRTGIGLLNDTSDPTGAAGAVENPTITGNKIIGTGAFTTTNGIRLRGLVTNANISGNDVRNLARGFLGEVVNTHSATGTEVHFNNFVGNPTGFVWNGAAAIDAENNWWGCNGGPGAVGCDPVAGSGAASVDTNPWIVLGVTASPNPILPLGTSTVTADMTQNSAPGPAGGVIPTVTVIFTATQGTIPSPVTTTAGMASSLFTSTSANSGIVCAKVDNQTICIALTIATDVRIGKQVTPTSQGLGLPITYILSFSNAGPGVATGVVISDRIPVSVTVTGVTSSTVGSGVVINQTSGPPNLAWSVNKLAAGEGGVITVTAVVSPNVALIGTTITNTVTITASGDITPTNNRGAAPLKVIILPGVLVVKKDSQPNSASNFAFTVSGATPIPQFTLDDDGNEVIDEPSSRTFNVTSGIYTVTELVPPAVAGVWFLTAIDCDPGSHSYNLANRRVAANVPANTTVTCTFTNQRPVKIHARKYQENGPNGQRNPGDPYLAGWTIRVYSSSNVLVDTKVTNAQGKANFDTLVPGMYKVCEVLQVGWTNTQPGGSGPGPGGANERCYGLLNLSTPSSTADVFFGNKLVVAAAGAEAVDSPLSAFAGVNIYVDTSHELMDDDSVYDDGDDENTPMPDGDVDFGPAAPAAPGKLYLPVIVK